MNKFAISSGGLGEALKRSASSLAAGNNSLHESAALITAANEVVQNPEKVGNAMKTVSMRIRAAKSELEDAGESTDGMAESTASLRAEIKALSGVDIMLDNSTFKSTYQILDELSLKWKDLSDISQATIVELMAGKHQGNVFASLMSNFQTARDALNTSLESSGSAMKEHAKWSESIEARLNKLKATWQSFAQTFMDSKTLKVGIDLLSGLVNILEKLIDTLGVLGTVGAGIVTKNLIGTLIGSFKNKKGDSSIVADVADDAANAADAVDELTDSTGKLTKNTSQSASAFGKFKNAVGGWIGVASIAITVISGLYNAWKKSKEEAAAARQEAIETADAFLESSRTFEQAYIKYSGRTDLTAEEEAELESAINGTVEALGDKSSALQNAVNSSNDYIASLEAIKKAELEQAAEVAQEKKEKAQEALDEAAKGWSSLDGSEVNIDFGTVRSMGHTTDNGYMLDIAKELAKKYFGDDFAKYFNEGGLSAQAKQASLNLSTDASIDEIVSYYNLLVDYQKELESSGYKDTNIFNNVTKAIEKMSGAMDVYVNGVYDSVKANYLASETIPKTAEEYVKMREAILADSEVQNLSVDQKIGLVNLLDTEYGKSIDLSDARTQARRLIGVVDKYTEKDAGQVETFLNMKTAVNNNECTVGDYLSEFEKVNSITDGWDEESKKAFDTSFGVDSDSIKKQYDDVYKYISRNYISKPNLKNMHGFDLHLFEETEIQRIQDLLNGLTLTELQAVANIKTEIDWERTSIADIKKQIEEEAKLIEAISFSVDLDLETEKLDNLATAVTESLSGVGLGNQSISLVEDMFGDLDNYDPNELFERTANGIRLNSEELRKLNDEYKQSNIDGLEEKMDALAERYNQTRDKLSDLTYGSEEYNQKLSELNDIEAQINATEQLASQYRGLASAYQLWQRTESAGSQRDMYESMIEGLENVDDEISRGWLDDGTIEFLRLIKGDTLSATATTKDLKAAYESLDDTIKNTTYSIRDFFTVDEDGNSTNTGVYNFLDAIGQLEEEKFGGKNVVKRENGEITGFDFKIVGGDEAIADALGISEELVQIMVRAADDAGFVVSMDGTYQQLDTLKDKAQEAADKLKNTFKVTDFEFNLGTGNEKSIQAQYKEALEIWGEFSKNKNSDGTINMNVEGAEDAFTLVSTLQSMVDQLGEPVYMELDATQVEKDMQEPLSKLQEYERLTKQENQLKLKGTDTSEIDKSQKEIIDYFEDLDPEIQASLGIKDLSREELQSKVESGEIEIPATIDLQVEMNQTMRDMVNVALYNAGVIDEDELKKRVDIEVYAENVNTEDVDEAVKEEVENTKSKAREANIEIIAETVGIENVDDLSSKLKDLDDKTVKAIAEVLGQVDVEKLKDTMSKLKPTEVEAIAKAIGEGDVDSLKTAISSLSPTYVQAIAEAFGYTDVQDLYNAIEQLDPKTVEAVANALGITDVESLKGAIDNVQGKDVEVNATTSGESKLTGLKSIIDGIKSKTVTITSWFKKIASGGSTRNDSNGFNEVNGTANVDGTTGRAFKQGSWGTKNSGSALVGELGREILVRDGRYYTIGDNGAEFIKYRKGDIIFNHRQTEELFANGKVTSGGGRAKAFASGTAFTSGSKGFGGLGKVVAVIKDGTTKKKKTTKKTVKETIEETVEESVSSNSSQNGSSGNGGAGRSDGSSVTIDTGKDSSGGGSSKEEFKETLDWIETKINRIERAIDKLDLKANSVYKSWSVRNKALSDEIVKVGEEIDIQQDAYERYLQEANSVGLSSEWVSKIQNGEIDIETVKDENLAEKIKNYQTWYEKCLECQDAVEQLKEKEAELYAQRFENIQTQYDAILQGYEHTEAMLNEYISQAEEKGFIVSKKYYEALIANEKSNIAELKKEQAELIAERDNAVAEGKITEGSEAWLEQCAAIDEVTQSIEEANTALLEYSNSIRDIDWQIFDLIQERISAISEEADFLIELMSNKKLFEDDGKLTSQGLATMALHGQNYNSYMYAADTYAEEIAKLNAQIANDPYDQELINRRNELLAQQREMILAAEESKESIKSLIEDGIELELEALDEKIQKYEEALNSQKD